MSTGDQGDVFGRIAGYLPAGWFGDAVANPYVVGQEAAAVPNSVPPRLGPLSAIQAWCAMAAEMLCGEAVAGGGAEYVQPRPPGVYAQLVYAALQTRIGSATDGWLDMIAGDFFGNDLPRKPGEADAVYRARIISNITVEKGTRAGVIKAVQALLGVTPTVFEPANPADTGGYNMGCAYNVAGGWGSTELPYTFFVRIPPMAQAAALPCNGYAGPLGGYGVGLGRYAVMTDFDHYIDRAAICAAVNNVRAVDSIGWIGIAS